ncbi:MAG: hypothetical protein ABI858_00670 [Pseudoxanthomonas sp.]
MKILNTPRAWVAASLLSLATLMLALVFSGKLTEQAAGVLSNLATELAGIVLTVIFVDWLFERRRLGDEIEKISLRALHQLDHAVWVWQGDARHFDLAELLARVNSIEPDDPLPPFTQNLFMQIGSKSSDTIRLSKEPAKKSEWLRKGLTDLANLCSVRDGSEALVPESIKLHLLSAIPLLAKAANLDLPKPAQLPISAHRITSIDHQHYRHFGRNQT